MLLLEELKVLPEKMGSIHKGNPQAIFNDTPCGKSRSDLCEFSWSNNQRNRWKNYRNNLQTRPDDYRNITVEIPLRLSP